MSDSYERIQKRIKGRQAAKDCWSISIADPTSDAPPSREWCEGFCDEIRKLTGVEGREQSINAADCGPIARLGNIPMPFGQHEGKPFDETPLEYLDWLCRSQEDFYKSLRAYLKHPDLESRRRGIEH